MSKEKINLEKLFNNNFDCYTQILSKFVEQEEESALTKDKFKELCLDFGKQLLELASDNAELNYYEDKEDWMKEPFNISIDNLGNIVGIDKQSILNTIKQIEL